MDINNIKELNNINVAAQRAKLGDIILALLKENEEIKEELKNVRKNKSSSDSSLPMKVIKNQEKSKATTIKELVNDFNLLISNLERYGYIEK